MKVMVIGPRQQGKSWYGWIKLALVSGIPPQVIQWRMSHNWPIDRLHAKTLEDL